MLSSLQIELVKYMTYLSADVFIIVDYPELTTEIDILKRKVPSFGQNLRDEVVAFVQTREQNLFKSPGVVEPLIGLALVELNCVALDPSDNRLDNGRVVEISR